MRERAMPFCTALFLVLISVAVIAAERIEHRAIVISNDYEFTAENGVCSGSGTLNDPYIIENWIIDAGYDLYGIKIHRTTRSFVIRNVEISGAAKSAIYLSYVKNGKIEDCRLTGNWIGVTLNYSSINRIAGNLFASNTDALRCFFSSNNQIHNNTFESNQSALWLDASDANEIIGNYVADGYTGIYLNLNSRDNVIAGNALVNNVHHAYTDASNVWDDGAKGNYWGGFRAIDANLDGIWDSAYQISSEGDQDRFPLTSHPLVPALPPSTCDV